METRAARMKTNKADKARILERIEYLEREQIPAARLPRVAFKVGGCVMLIENTPDGLQAFRKVVNKRFKVSVPKPPDDGCLTRFRSEEERETWFKRFVWEAKKYRKHQARKDFLRRIRNNSELIHKQNLTGWLARIAQAHGYEDRDGFLWRREDEALTA